SFASSVNAWRIGPRFTSNTSHNCASVSFEPGASRCSRIAARMRSAIASGFKPFDGTVDVSDMIGLRLLRCILGRHQELSTIFTFDFRQFSWSPSQQRTRRAYTAAPNARVPLGAGLL